MAKPISQNEARRLRKQVQFLTQQIKNQRKTWKQEYVGVEIYRFIDRDSSIRVRVARKLGHSVVVVGDDDSEMVRLVALPHPAQQVI